MLEIQNLHVKFHSRDREAVQRTDLQMPDMSIWVR